MSRVIKNKKGTYTIINNLREEIIVNEVDAIFPFHNEIATFRAATPTGKKFGYINSNGVKITKYLYDHAEDFGEKYGLVKIGKLHNLIDRQGNELFEWKYTYISPFMKNTFIVKNQNGYYGLIDIDGKVILNFIYEDIFSITHKARLLITN